MDKTSFNIKQMIKHLNAMGIESLQTGLTQADYQMIQVLVAEKITKLEEWQGFAKACKEVSWLRADKDDVDGFQWFKALNKCKLVISRIKTRKNKLAHLQYKLKYLAKNY